MSNDEAIIEGLQERILDLTQIMSLASEVLKSDEVKHNAATELLAVMLLYDVNENDAGKAYSIFHKLMYS